MKMCDYILNQEPTFENRLMYAQLLSPYDTYSDSKFGYLDASKELLETYKPIEELEDYINEFEVSQDTLDEYDRAYIQAYRDFIKQESSKKESATNE